MNFSPYTVIFLLLLFPCLSSSPSATNINSKNVNNVAFEFNYLCGCIMPLSSKTTSTTAATFTKPLTMPPPLPEPKRTMPPPLPKPKPTMSPSQTLPTKKPNPPETHPTKKPNPPETNPTKKPNPPETHPTKKPNPPETHPTKKPNPPETHPTKKPNPPETHPTKKPNPPETHPTKKPNPPETHPTKKPNPPETHPTKKPTPPPKPNQGKNTAHKSMETMKVALNAYTKLTSKIDDDAKFLAGLETFKELITIFVPEYAFIVDTFFDIIAGGIEGPPSEEFVLIKKFEAMVTKRFDVLDQKIDQLEKNIKNMLLQNTYLQTFSMHLENQKQSYLHLLRSNGSAEANANTQIFIEDCTTPYRPHQLLDNLNTIITAYCIKPMNSTNGLAKIPFYNASNEGKDEDKCLLSAVYEKFEGKRHEMIKSVESIKMDIMALMPVALACIKLNNNWDNVTKEQLTNRINETVIDIIDTMFQWTNSTLKGAFPYKFTPVADAELLKYEFSESDNDNDVVKKSYEELAERIRVQCQERGMPMLDYQVHVFFNGDVKKGFFHVTSHKQFKTFEVHDDNFFTRQRNGFTVTVVRALFLDRFLENSTDPNTSNASYPIKSQQQMLDYLTLQDYDYSNFDQFRNWMETRLADGSQGFQKYLRAVVAVEEGWDASKFGFDMWDDTVPVIGMAVSEQQPNSTTEFEMHSAMIEHKVCGKLVGTTNKYYCIHVAYFF